MTREQWIESVAKGEPGPTPALDADLIDAMVAAGMEAIRRDLGATKRIGATALKLAKKLGDPRSMGLSERLLGHVHLLKGHSAKAIPHYVRARRHFADFPADHAATATAMLQALAYVGDFEEAFSVAEQAQAFFVGEGDTVRAARIEANKANALHRLDRLPEAKAAYERALAVLRQEGTLADVAIAMRNFAVTLMGLLEFDAADAMYAETRERFEAEQQGALVLEVDLNRAYLLGRRGRIREALAAYRNLRERLSLDLAELTFEVGHSMLDQADLMLEVGLWNEASQAAEQASKVFEGLGLKFETGKSRLILALAQIRLGHAAQAKPNLNASVRLLRRVPNPVWTALSLQAKAEAGLAMNDSQTAIEALRRAESMLAEAVGLDRRTRIADDLSELLLEAGAFDEVALRLEREEPVRAAALALRARLARARGEETAEPLMRSALEKLDAHRAALGASLLRQASARAHESILRRALDLFVEPSDRFEVVRRLKHQSLAELVESPEAYAPDPVIRHLREQLFALQSAPTDEAHERSAVRARVELDLVQRLRAAMLEADSAHERLDAHPAAPTGTRLVELFVHGGRLRAILVDPGHVSEVELAPLEAIQRGLRLFRMNLARGLREPNASADHLLDSLGHMLAPVWDAPRETNRFVIGREPSLAALPFHALRLEGGFAYERGEIVVAPTVSAWATLNARAHNLGHGVAVIGFADEFAPEIADEARTIARLMDAETSSLNERLTPDRLADLIQGVRIVHLAAHGIHREDRPVLSSLRLGGGEWSVFDLSQLRLKAELVTLSGCSTGHASAGSELDAQGFIEALLVAGARNVLASLWDVHDGAARLWMTAFFSELREGTSVSAAYRATLQHVRTTHPHPAFWAPFALFGGPIENPVSNPPTPALRKM